ncbi:TIGR00269 family protein [Candidatus Woesearchaeota archaeon]|nr:MAG: TIGR00269 family protein [Candidatus Woesearchaeota archaeon]
MKCTKCNKKAVIDSPRLCEKHFIIYFETKIKKTILDYKLINEGEKIIVGVSGGKDSLTLLYLLQKWYENVEAISIDEGIGSYREKTLKYAEEFCKRNSIKWKVYSFKQEFGKTLDEMIQKLKHPCTVCGVLRKYLLNKYSRGYDKLAIAHNMDDEAESILMNFLKNNLGISSRLGPLVGTLRHKKFTLKVKPLYFCSEKEVITYAKIKGFYHFVGGCPNIAHSFRNKVRSELKKFENKYPGSVKALVYDFIKQLPRLKVYFRTDQQLKECEKCGEPTLKKLCNACLLLEKLKMLKKQ